MTSHIARNMRDIGAEAETVHEKIGNILIDPALCKAMSGVTREPQELAFVVFTLYEVRSIKCQKT